METSIRLVDLWLSLKMGIQVHVKSITTWNYQLDNNIREKFMFTLLIWSERLQVLCFLF